MEIKDVIELIKAVSDNGLTGFKIEQGDTKIVIKKEQPAVIQAGRCLSSGGNVLFLSGSGCRGLCKGRRSCEKRPGHRDRGGHEADE